MRTDVSQKMRDVSAFAMIAIVLTHSISILTSPEASRWNVGLQCFVTQSLTCWAVPFFFVVSGYWCSKKVDAGLFKFFRTKVRSLLLPYLIWCLLGLVLLTPLTVVNNVITGAPIMVRTAFNDVADWGAVINKIFGISQFGPTAIGPLWYLRSLMIFTVTTPVLKAIAERRTGRCLLAAIVAYCLFKPACIPGLEVSLASFGWFAGGFVVASLAVEERGASKSLAVVSSCLFVLLAVLKLNMAIQSLVGIMAIWCMYDTFSAPYILARRIVGDQFWTYCFHIIPCKWYIAGMLYCLGKSDLSTVAILLSCPFVALGVTRLLERIVKGSIPRFYHDMVGGRR